MNQGLESDMGQAYCDSPTETPYHALKTLAPYESHWAQTFSLYPTGTKKFGQFLSTRSAFGESPKQLFYTPSI